MSLNLARTPMSRIAGRVPLCVHCRHTRASHSIVRSRCWSISCGCPGYVAGPTCACHLDELEGVEVADECPVHGLPS